MRATSRHLVAVLTLGATALAAAGLTATAASAAPSALDPVPSHGHKVVYPTLQAAQHARAAHAIGRFVNGTGVLAYGGGVSGVGVTTAAPKVYLVFWGSQWGTAATDSNGDTTFSGDPKGMAPRLQEMFKGIGTGSEQWSGVMTQYCDTTLGATSCPASAAHVGYPNGGALAGVWYDGSTAAPGTATDNQIGTEALAAAHQFGTDTAAHLEAQYVVVSPTGTHPGGFNTSTANWCAWHDWSGDSTLNGGAVKGAAYPFAFTNLPYVTDLGASCGQNYVNSGSTGTLDGVTIVSGHEYAETITDQFPAGGWTDRSGYENADKCAWVGVGGTGGAQNVSFDTGSFAMQGTYSNDSANCRISHPIVTTGAGTSTVTVTSTSNQSTPRRTYVSVPMKATDSAGKAITSWSATGLPPGLSIDFSTGVISGTTGRRTGSYNVKVTATASDGATGTAAFTWTIT